MVFKTHKMQSYFVTSDGKVTIDISKVETYFYDECYDLVVIAVDGTYLFSGVMITQDFNRFIDQYRGYRGYMDHDS